MGEQSRVKEFLTFKLSNQIYCVEIIKIREILTYPIVTELPNMSKWIKGVINLRGEVTPILDLRVRFNTTDKVTYSDKTIIIAVKTFDNRMIGLVVDEVKDVEEIDETRVLEVPDMGLSIKKEYLKGLIKKDAKMIVIVDIDKLLNRQELEKLSEICEE